jgi:hypothetical protein
MALAACTALAGSAQAATVDFSFGSLVNVSAGGTMAGTGPWLDLQISDTTTAGTLAFNINSLNLTGSQTISGIFLNLPTALAATLTGISISSPSVTNAPIAFVPYSSTSNAANSSFSTTQNIAGLAAGVGGSYDVYVKFPTGVLTPGGSAAAGETFNLVFAGGAPTANDFLTMSLPSGAGKPSYYALAAFTNSGGTGGTGTAYVAPVPLPAAALLFGTGLTGLLGFARRQKKTA